MTPEARDLLAALQTQGFASEARLGSLRENDWEALVDLAETQRMSPLLYHLCRELQQALPRSAQERLRARAKHSTIRVLHLRSALGAFLRRLNDAGLEVLVLKGLHVSCCYPAPGLREMNDVDVLTRQRDVEQVAAIARGLGYATTSSEPHAAHHYPPLVLGTAAVEIHWQLADSNGPPLVDSEELFSRAQPIGLPGWRGLCAEDLLIHICSHAADGHQLGLGLRPLMDIRYICKTHDIDWDAVAERARRWSVGRSVALVARLASRHAEAVIPETFFDQLGDDPPRAIQELAIDYIVDVRSADLPPSAAVADLLELPDVRSRLHLIRRRIDATRVHDAKRWRTQLLRATGLIHRHTRWIVRAWLRRRATSTSESLASRRTLTSWLRGT